MFLGVDRLMFVGLTFKFRLSIGTSITVYMYLLMGMILKNSKKVLNTDSRRQGEGSEVQVRPKVFKTVFQVLVCCNSCSPGMFFLLWARFDDFTIFVCSCRFDR